MQRLRAFFFILLFVAAALPGGAHAQSSSFNLPILNPNFHIVPDAHELDARCPVNAPLGFGGTLQLIQNLMNAGIALAIVVSVLVIVFAGVLWILTPTNPENHSQAKKVLTNAVIGFIIVISAWLIVDFVMKILYVGGDGERAGFLPWNAILTGGDVCITASKDMSPLFSGDPRTVPDVTGSPGGNSGGNSGGSSGGSSAGRCTVPASGPCSAANLQAVFGSAARQAAQICTAESGGNPQNLSRSDRLADGKAYSVGLFQINLTNSFTHKVQGKNCSDAFSGPCQGRAVIQAGRSAGTCVSRIIDPGLYNACVAAAQNPAINIRAARDLYDGDWGRWSTARTCNLPR